MVYENPMASGMTGVLRVGLLLALLGMTGCASLSARSSFSKAQKAEKKGETEQAIALYQKAAEQDPKKEEYQTALARMRKGAAEERASEARGAESRGDYKEAVRKWDQALRFLPNSAAMKARRSLAELRTKQADPVAFYKAAKKLAEALPNDENAKQTLKEARKTALKYHLRLAKMYTNAESWDQAFVAFESAKKIAPKHRAFRSSKYRRVRAHYYEALGDEHMKKGDTLAAYQAYQEAANIKSSSKLTRKMKQAKRGAGSMLEQIEQARSLERLEQWEDAAEIYSLLQARESTPPEVAKRAKEIRAKSAQIRASRAKSFAERGLVQKACAELTMALEHTDGPAKAITVMHKAVEELTSSRPAQAKEGFQEAQQIAPDLMILQVTPKIVLAMAKRVYQKAKGRSDSDPAESLVELRRLSPFAGALDGYEAQKKKLIKRAFGSLLERAEVRAAEGKFEEATQFVATALEISKPPAAIKERLAQGVKALEQNDFANARTSFDGILKKNERSRLAKTGMKVATDAYLAQLHHEAAEAMVVEDPSRAAASYRAILEIDPNDPSAAAGILELKEEMVGKAVKSAQDHAKAGRKGSAFVYYQRVLDLDPKHEEAKVEIDKAKAGFALAKRPTGWVAQSIRGDRLGESCPEVEKKLRDLLILYLTRSEKLGVEYLKRQDALALDDKKDERPAVVLRTAVEHCVVGQSDGSMQATYQVLVGGAVSVQDRVKGKFDPSKFPKDELEDGLDPEQIRDSLLSSVAKRITKDLQKNASKLESWRAAEAKARMKKGDAESVARWYAGLVTSDGLTDEERRIVEELKRFLMNRYR